MAERVLRAGIKKETRETKIKHYLSNQEESCKVMSELEAELQLLSSTLDDKGAELCGIIKEETQRKEAELQVNIIH